MLTLSCVRQYQCLASMCCITSNRRSQCVRRALRLGTKTERTSATGRPPSRVPLLIFLLIFSNISCRFYCLTLNTAASSCDTRRVRATRSFQSQSFPPSLPRSFILLFIFLSLTPLVSLSRTTLTVDQAAATRHPYALSFILFYHTLYALSLSIHSPSPAPPRSPLRYKILDSTHVYKRLLLIKDGIDHRPLITRS